MLISTKALCKASWNEHKYIYLQCCTLFCRIYQGKTPILQIKQYCKFTNLTNSDLCLYITSNTLTCSLRWFLMKMVFVYLHENVTREYKKCQPGGISSSWRLEPLSFSSDLPHTSRKVWGEAWIHFKNFRCKCALSSCASHLRCMHWRPARVENFCPFLSRTSKLLTRSRKFWSKAGNLFFAAKQEKYATFRSIVAGNIWFDCLAFCEYFWNLGWIFACCKCVTTFCDLNLPKLSMYTLTSTLLFLTIEITQFNI